jgi:hypothetical protein
VSYPNDDGDEIIIQGFEDEAMRPSFGTRARETTGDVGSGGHHEEQEA